MKRFLLVMVAVLVVAAGLGYAVMRAETTSGGQASTSAPMLSRNAVNAPMEGVPAPGPAKTVADQAYASDGGAAPASGSVGEADVFGAPTGGVGPRVIKTAYLTLQVPKDGFDGAWGDATMVAKRYGGFIVSSSSSGEKSRSGDLLIRVPSGSFDAAMSDLRGLGDAEKESVDGQEVTDQFIDLNARLKSWQAQQAVLLKLMDRANSIGETMTVQREIQQVQVQIEQIKGQLRVLRDQTSFATIQLSMHEPGAAPVKPATEAPSLADAWAKAWAGFLSVISLVIVGLGYLIPIGLIALVVWLVARRRPRAVSAA